MRHADPDVGLLLWVASLDPVRNKGVDVGQDPVIGREHVAKHLKGPQAVLSDDEIPHVIRLLDFAFKANQTLHAGVVY